MAEGEYTPSDENGKPEPFYYPKHYRGVLQDMLTAADIVATMAREKRRSCDHFFEQDGGGWIVCRKCGYDKPAVMEKQDGSSSTSKQPKRSTRVQSGKRDGNRRLPGQEEHS